MNCIHCGNQVFLDQMMCSNCGKPIKFDEIPTTKQRNNIDTRNNIETSNDIETKSKLPVSDRVFAGLSYFSTLFLPIILPLIIYIMISDSRFVRYHAIKAMKFQVIINIFTTIFGAIVISLVGEVIGFGIFLPFVIIIAIIISLIYGIRAIDGKY